MRSTLRTGIWIAVALLGAAAYATIAFQRGESLNSAYLVTAAVCSYAIGFRFYAKWIAARVLALDDRRAPPCEVHEDGRDFVRTNRWIVFGHHFAAISGPGPLVGPVLAAQFGYLPGTLWLLIGAVLGGAVQDFVILFCSLRRDGKSLAQMVREEINTAAGVIGIIAILSIMVILLAVLALVVVKALAESPWGVFTVAATIPIALLMGGYLRFLRVGKVLEVSAIGVVLLLLAVWGGQYVHGHPEWARVFSLGEETLAWTIIAYGFAASVLPVWLLLAPRDYLSTFMKLGTIVALAAGVCLVRPDLEMPALSQFTDGSGLVVPGKLFPFCFITIACGAISGFHSLISSGVTPKILTRENYVRSVGYGAMCLESLVAIMAMVAACTLEPGVYLGMNVGDASPDLATKAASITAKVRATGIEISPEAMQTLADQVKEKSLYGRTGGAATLAVGMARIFSHVTHGRWIDLWYHFAIMFEALFILTTLDAGTRVGRYLVQDLLGNVSKRLGDVRFLPANFLASGLIVAGWGAFLIQGVRDPEGGIKALWPLFGIANQMLAAIALCLATTVILKMHLHPAGSGRTSRPALALVTGLPLVWLLAVTMTAGIQKVFHSDPRIGFLAQARVCDQRIGEARAVLQSNPADAERSAAEQTLHTNIRVRFNQRVDAVAASLYLITLTLFVLLSTREWILLLARRRLAELHETPPVWLADYAVVEARPFRWFNLLALALALARELGGEAAFDREKQLACACPQQSISDPKGADAAAFASGHTHGRISASRPDHDGPRYAAWLEQRYRSPRKCC